MKSSRQAISFRSTVSSAQHIGVLLLTAVCFYSCDTPASVEPYRDHAFIKLYGGDGSEEGKDLVALPDGGFVLAGSSTARDILNRNEDVYVVRTDSVGEVIWQVWIDAFDGNTNESANSMILSKDGTALVICGKMLPSDAQQNNHDVYVVKVSLQTGEVQSEHAFGETMRDEVGTDIFETTSGFFITATSQDVNGSKYFLVETDENLDPLPDRSRYIPYNTPVVNYSARSYEYPDEFNPIICFGSSERGTNGSATFWYQAFTYKSASNSLGTLEYYGSPDADEYCTDAYRTIDGGFVLTGFRQGLSASKEMIVKIDPQNLRMMWTQVYINEFNRNVKDCSIIQTSDGGYLISSTIELQPPKNDEISLLKVDFRGEEVWRKTFGSDENDAGSRVVELKDNSYVVVGTFGFDINPTSSSKMALMKVSANGELMPF